MSTSPTQRALAELRETGYVSAVVEKWNPHAGIRQDLFGIIDILAICAPGPILGVQVTSGSNASKRVQKSLESKALPIWLDSGGRYEVWSYAKQGPRGMPKVWKLRRQLAKRSELGAYFEDISGS